MNEQLARVFGRTFEMELIGLRYFNVYGPRQDPSGPYAAVIPRFFSALLEGRPPIFYWDGRQSRDFTHVADAIQANLLAARAPSSACGAAYNIAGGVQTSVGELARLAQVLLGVSGQPEQQAARPGDVLHSLADLTQSEKRLGYKPRIP